ncbi:hypothetical protein DIRU0_B06898 [Diutina rugosa]
MVHDYHQVISPRELLRDFPKSIAEGLTEKQEYPWTLECRCECSICLSPLKFRVAWKVHSKVCTHKYMVTPCKHMFHTDCLKSWIKLRRRCPVCRRRVPRLPASDASSSSGSSDSSDGSGSSDDSSSSDNSSSSDGSDSSDTSSSSDASGSSDVGSSDESESSAE